MIKQNHTSVEEFYPSFDKSFAYVLSWLSCIVPYSPSCSLFLICFFTYFSDTSSRVSHHSCLMCSLALCALQARVSLVTHVSCALLPLVSSFASCPTNSLVPSAFSFIDYLMNVALFCCLFLFL